MAMTADKLGGTYIPLGGTAQRFANGGMNAGVQPSMSGYACVVNNRGGAIYSLSITNTAARPFGVDELIRVLRQAQRSGRM